MGSTPTYALPYPELTDSANVPRDQKLLAEATESSLAALAATVVAPVIYRAAAGRSSIAGVPANGGVSLAITYPVGRFTQIPVALGSGDSSGYGFGMAAGSTQTGVTLRYYNPTASVPSGVYVHWLAVQMTSGSGPGLLAAVEPSGSPVVCHTEGCANREIPVLLDLAYIDPDGITQQITQVACGVCSQPITDIRR